MYRKIHPKDSLARIITKMLETARSMVRDPNRHPDKICKCTMTGGQCARSLPLLLEATSLPLLLEATSLHNPPRVATFRLNLHLEVISHLIPVPRLQMALRKAMSLLSRRLRRWGQIKGEPNKARRLDGVALRQLRPIMLPELLNRCLKLQFNFSPNK